MIRRVESERREREHRKKNHSMHDSTGVSNFSERVKFSSAKLSRIQRWLKFVGDLIEADPTAVTTCILSKNDIFTILTL